MKVHVALLIDRSGSMEFVQEDAQGTINAFLKEQKELPDDGSTIAIYSFAGNFMCNTSPQPIKDDCGFALYPGGGTALLDAVAETIRITSDYVGYEEPDAVILGILTDGQENASRKTTKEVVKKMIEGVQSQGWEVIFLSSDLDAIDDALKDYGTHAGSTIAITADASGYAAASKVLNMSVSQVRNK